MEHVDLDAARKMVSVWLDEHPNGTLPQMAGELKRNYPEFPAEMTVVLRGMMTAELRRRTSPPEGPADPAAAGAPRGPAAQRRSAWKTHSGAIGFPVRARSCQRAGTGPVARGGHRARPVN